MIVNLIGGLADAEPVGAPGAEGGGLLRDREVQAELPARRRVRARPRRRAGRGGQVRLCQVSLEQETGFHFVEKYSLFLFNFSDSYPRQELRNSVTS